MTNTAFAVLMAVTMIPVTFLSVKTYMVFSRPVRNRVK